MPDPKIVTITINTPLTEEERHARSLAHAHLCAELAAEEEAIKEAGARARKALKLKKLQEADLRVVVITGTEDRQVEVEEFFLPERGIVQQLRRGTGELLRTRKMTDEEVAAYKRTGDPAEGSVN